MHVPWLVAVLAGTHLSLDKLPMQGMLNLECGATLSPTTDIPAGTITTSLIPCFGRSVDQSLARSESTMTTLSTCHLPGATQEH